MITLNARYLINANKIAEEIEKQGFTVCIVNEQDLMYEEDLTREHRQNLSAHDWNDESEYWAMHKLLKYND